MIVYQIEGSAVRAHKLIQTRTCWESCLQGVIPRKSVFVKLVCSYCILIQALHQCSSYCHLSANSINPFHLLFIYIIYNHMFVFKAQSSAIKSVCNPVKNFSTSFRYHCLAIYFDQYQELAKLCSVHTLYKCGVQQCTRSWVQMSMISSKLCLYFVYQFLWKQSVP